MKRNFIAILLAMAMVLCPLTAFAGEAAEASEHSEAAQAAEGQITGHDAAASEENEDFAAEASETGGTPAESAESAESNDDAAEKAEAGGSETVAAEPAKEDDAAGENDSTEAVLTDAGVPAADADEAAAAKLSKAGSAGTEARSSEKGDTETGETEPADPEPPVIEGWNADRTVFYLKGGVMATGLFKAPMKDGTSALFYANNQGSVVRKPGLIKVRAPKDRYICTVDSEGRRGFRKVGATDKKTYSYLIGENGEGAIVEASKLYKTRDGSRTYFIQENGTVRTANGFVNAGSGRYYIKPNGLVRTKAGWLKFKDRKYLIGANGKVRTKTGAFTVNGRRYVIPDSSKYGALCITAGKVVKAGGRLCFVKNKYGVLGCDKTYRNGKRVYHVNKKGIVKTGRHKWKDGKYYFSVKKGYLKRKTALLSKKGRRFLVNKGGLITVSEKFTYKKKTYIANKYGYIKTGLFKWKGTLYYAGEKGVLEQDAGIVRISGNDYYVASDGTVYTNKIFWFKGRKYASDSEGVLLAGLIRKGSSYYYADPDYEIVTTKGILNIGGKYYFCKKGGRLARNEWINYQHRHYYAGDSAAFKTSAFSYNGITVSPDSRGEISDENYKKVFPDKSADDNSGRNSDQTRGGN